MNFPENLSRLDLSWTYSRFIELSTGIKNQDIAAAIEKPEGERSSPPVVKFSLPIKLRADEVEIAAKNDMVIVKEISKRLQPSIPKLNPETKLKKITWYRIWFALAFDGILPSERLLKSYAKWRVKKASLKFEVSYVAQEKRKYSKSKPIDLYILGGIPSAEELQFDIELVAPLIAHAPADIKNKRDAGKTIGAGNVELIKNTIERAVNSGNIKGLCKSKNPKERHKYKENKDQLFHELVDKFGLSIKESVFKRGISFFVQTKAKSSR